MFEPCTKHLLHDGNPDETSPKKLKLNDSPAPLQLLVQSESISKQMVDLQIHLSLELKTIFHTLCQPPVAYIYNPVEYALEPHVKYINKFCTEPKKVLFVGLNPGPNGMCQTGVPFGEISSVRDWLEIDGKVDRPQPECPLKPILGFQCKDREPSGLKFWSYFRQLCKDVDAFFKNCFVMNYCPIAFLTSSGKNITPSEFKDDELKVICNRTYLNVINLLKPEVIVCIGRYVENNTRKLLKEHNFENIRVLYLIHPSPRIPNNTNWPEKVDQFLNRNNLHDYFN